MVANRRIMSLLDKNQGLTTAQMNLHVGRKMIVPHDAKIRTRCTKKMERTKNPLKIIMLLNKALESVHALPVIQNEVPITESHLKLSLLPLSENVQTSSPVILISLMMYGSLLKQNITHLFFDSQKQITHKTHLL